MWLMAVVGVAPCQCFSPGSNQTTSPGRITSARPPSRCTRPQPAVTISVWPSGWVCQAVRAPGSKVTTDIASNCSSPVATPWKVGDSHFAIEPAPVGRLDAAAGGGDDVPLQAGGRGRAPLAHRPGPGDRGGHRRPGPEPDAGARPPGVRPRRVSPDGD